MMAVLVAIVAVLLIGLVALTYSYVRLYGEVQDFKMSFNVYRQFNSSLNTSNSRSIDHIMKILDVQDGLLNKLKETDGILLKNTDKVLTYLGLYNFSEIEGYIDIMETDQEIERTEDNVEE